MHMPSNRIAILAAISAAVILFAGVLLYQVQAQSLLTVFNTGEVMSTAPGTVSLGGTQNGPAPTSVAAVPAQLEMHIANNGLVLLRGARVIAISGSTIDVMMAFGLTNFTWAVQTTMNTNFLTPQGAKGSLGDIHVGAFVTVTGMLAGNDTEPALSAQYVREQQ